MTTATSQKRDDGFRAFISYAHRDAKWAKKIHRALETYRLPRGLAQELGGARIGRVFLDRSELATSTSLSDRIAEALTSSTNLILICSPAARASRWVNEEVRRFRAMGRGDRIFCLIVNGDPVRADDGGCFPPALLEVSHEQAAPEPLAADIRPGNDRPADARLKLIAGLLDVPFDALRRREAARRQRLLGIVAGVSIGLLGVMAILTAYALISRAEAVRQRDEAQITAMFLQDVFDKADPASVGGKEVTLRSVVDGAAASALRSPELARQPEVKASLLVVLARVYARMQLVSEGRRLINAARAISFTDPEVRLRMLAVDASLCLFESNYAEMRRSLTEAFTLLDRHPEFSVAHRPQLLLYRAQLEKADGDNASAIRDFAELRRVSLASSPPDRDKLLLALLGEGVAAVDDGQPDRATPLLRRVIDTRTKMGEPLHPDVLTAINTLGAAEAKRGNMVAAESWFRQAERLQLQVYGGSSLIVARTRSNLGRALVEQRRFAEAIRLLETARAVIVAQIGDGADTLANLDDSLGLARSGAGDVAGARAAFEHGLLVARKNKMSKEVELLADHGELECRAANASMGLKLLSDARQLLKKLDLPEPWRSARLDAIQGECLLAARNPSAAKPFISSSLPLVTARWGADSLFGQSVTANAVRAGLSK